MLKTCTLNRFQARNPKKLSSFQALEARSKLGPNSPGGWGRGVASGFLKKDANLPPLPCTKLLSEVSGPPATHQLPAFSHHCCRIGSKDQQQAADLLNNPGLNMFATPLAGRRAGPHLSLSTQAALGTGHIKVFVSSTALPKLFLRMKRRVCELLPLPFTVLPDPSQPTSQVMPDD